MRWLQCFVLMFCLFFTGQKTNAQTIFLPDWKIVSSFKLWSPIEQQHSKLLDDKQVKLILLLSTECPMCISYTRTIAELYAKYSSIIGFYGIFPGRSYTDKQIKEFVSSYQLSIPVLVDPKMKLTKSLKGEVTPEVFLFDASGKCVYKGAIDNWLVELGKKKIKPDQHYLQDAIEQTLRGEPVLISYNKPQGCLLNEY